MKGFKEGIGSPAESGMDAKQFKMYLCLNYYKTRLESQEVYQSKHVLGIW